MMYSRNRGVPVHAPCCAGADIILSFNTGRPVQMVGTYDETTDRSYPDYPGGTSLQRWHRKLLRDGMEVEGFTVYEAEWWHFDFMNWQQYPIMNLPFDQIVAHAPRGRTGAGK